MSSNPPYISPERMYRLRYHPEQHAWMHSLARFNVVPAGRRSGKTERAKRKLVKRALLGTSFSDPRFFAAAPTRDQAKRIFWDDLRRMVLSDFVADISYSDLTISLVNGSTISVIGMDKPERIEGSPWDGGVLDEYANMKAHAWGAHVRPALSDRRGWCDFTGVPEGRNHYYDLYQAARAEMIAAAAEGRIPLWAAFTWHSSDILPADEVEAARADLDELTYQQEYEASFVNFQGRAYYKFSESTHCAALEYHPRGNLILCFDFNVDPGVAVICQEGEDETRVIGEVWIPQNSNTEAVCRKIAADWGHHQGKVFVYGDATGGARGSAKVRGSDWDIIKSELGRTFDARRVFYKVPKSNPAERARINAVNTRLQSADGTVRLRVDPSKAPHVVRDLEGVRLLQGGSGELDKKHDAKLTHISDALGYYIQREFPTTERGKWRAGGYAS